MNDKPSNPDNKKQVQFHLS